MERSKNGMTTATNKKSTHLYAFLTAKVGAQTLYGYVYLKMKSKAKVSKK